MHEAESQDKPLAAMNAEAFMIGATPTALGVDHLIFQIDSDRRE